MCVHLCVCPVCAAFLGRFYDSLKDNEVSFTSVDIEKALMQSCNDAKGKENRFVSHLRTHIHTQLVQLWEDPGAPGEGPS